MEIQGQVESACFDHAIWLVSWTFGLVRWCCPLAVLQSFWCYPRCVGECGHFSWRIRNHNFHGALDSNVWWSFHGDGIVHITFSSAEDQDLLFGRSVHPPRTWWTLWERGLQHWWMPFSCERAPGAVFSRILIEPLVLIRDCGFPKGKSWWQIGVLAVVHRKICRHLCHPRVVHIPDYWGCGQPNTGSPSTKVHCFIVPLYVLRAIGFGCACFAGQFSGEKTIDLWLEEFRAGKTHLRCCILLWKIEQTFVRFFGVIGSLECLCENYLLATSAPKFRIGTLLRTLTLLLYSARWTSGTPAGRLSQNSFEALCTMNLWVCYRHLPFLVPMQPWLFHMQWLGWSILHWACTEEVRNFERWAFS